MCSLKYSCFNYTYYGIWVPEKRCELKIIRYFSFLLNLSHAQFCENFLPINTSGDICHLMKHRPHSQVAPLKTAPCPKYALKVEPIRTQNSKTQQVFALPLAEYHILLTSSFIKVLRKKGKFELTEIPTKTRKNQNSWNLSCGNVTGKLVGSRNFHILKQKKKTFSSNSESKEHYNKCDVPCVN